MVSEEMKRELGCSKTGVHRVDQEEGVVASIHSYRLNGRRRSSMDLGVGRGQGHLHAYIGVKWCGKTADNRGEPDSNILGK